MRKFFYSIMGIEFRGKEISELEAKNTILFLEKGLAKPNLRRKEKTEYSYFEKIRDHSFLKIPKSEEEFLINGLEVQINVGEFVAKLEYCEKNGHEEESSHIASGLGGTRVYATCKNCKMMYERNLTSDEWKGFDDLMRTPLI